jgi:DNA-3-methyladenine glycosylase
VYFTYGMHFCPNVVTGITGQGSAVLLRAGEPLQGLRTMGRRRGTDDPRLLCSGPARLCEAFGITRRQNGIDLVRDRDTYILAGQPVHPSRVGVTSRIGIRSGVDRPWRFFVSDDPFVSRGRPSDGGGVTGSLGS